MSRNQTWSVESVVYHLHHEATEDLLASDGLIQTYIATTRSQCLTLIAISSA